MMNKMSIKKDDTVVVITGKDKGQRGKVLTVIPKEGKVVVMRVCPKCDKPTRAASKMVDGKKVRVCKHCGAEI